MQQSPSSAIVSLADNVDDNGDQNISNDRMTNDPSLLYLVSSLTPPRYLTEGFIKVNVLDVCENGAQQLYFNLGLDQLKQKNPTLFRLLKIERRKNKQSIEKKLTPADIANWLMDADIHFILSHVHQGMLLQHNHDWTVDIIQREILKLMYHRGFPQGQNLKCPIFLQDKWKYLVALKTKTLDTLKVPIPIDLENATVLDRISR